MNKSNARMMMPVFADTDMSKGVFETLFQTMKKNPILLGRFKEILKEK